MSEEELENEEWYEGDEPEPEDVEEEDLDSLDFSTPKGKSIAKIYESQRKRLTQKLYTAEAFAKSTRIKTVKVDNTAKCPFCYHSHTEIVNAKHHRYRCFACLKTFTIERVRKNAKHSKTQ